MRLQQKVSSAVNSANKNTKKTKVWLKEEERKIERQQNVVVANNNNNNTMDHYEKSSSRNSKYTDTTNINNQSHNNKRSIMFNRNNDNNFDSRTVNKRSLNDNRDRVSSSTGFHSRGNKTARGSYNDDTDIKRNKDVSSKYSGTNYDRNRPQSLGDKPYSRGGGDGDKYIRDNRYVEKKGVSRGGDNYRHREEVSFGQTQNDRYPTDQSQQQQQQQLPPQEQLVNIIGMASVLSAFKNRNKEDLVRLFIERSVHERYKTLLFPLVKHFASNNMVYRIFNNNDGQMNAITRTNSHEGICMVVRQAATLTPEEAFEKEMERIRFKAIVPLSKSPLLNQAKELITQRVNHDGTRPVVVLLDNVGNPYNIGTIVRACTSFGIRTLFAYNDPDKNESGRVNPFSSRVYQLSRGGMDHIDLVHMEARNEVINMIKEFKKEGWRVVSTAGNKDISNVAPLYSDDATKTLGNINSPLVLVFGSESEGISKGIIKLSDKCLMIPSTGHIECLNVSQALSIVLAECHRLELKHVKSSLEAGVTGVKKQQPRPKDSLKEITPELLGITSDQIYRDDMNTNRDSYDDEVLEEGLEEDLRDYDEMIQKVPRSFSSQW
ncbi:hypothetical protein SAMD00019534_090560 [Acytostelium subglobosum LB1]|uniref:hypothetical protein n=1 Tax=Acytostelium subglobosum LB1 TaxID=1410327 RepID=UPI000644C320|nr:hypothetical protein SAMD00019534_090560 [Acytostelium subglobosum LB1]GAM25881.1 hypothetical protein SAMD00019534_090560 [Acytostelium subglobosum LB1]|eukprot:XP_012750924.1 hypothetical protein SAMD00019534_090560 [Acytostelium subglobosum LB1]